MQASDRPANQVAISAIFDWFSDDWKPQYAIDDGFTGSDKQQATLNFISQYLPAADQAYLKAATSSPTSTTTGLSTVRHCLPPLHFLPQHPPCNVLIATSNS